MPKGPKVKVKPKHRPLLPTANNIANIKDQFVAQQSNKIVATGAEYSKTAKEVSEEQLHKEAEQQQFFPWPSGLICEWVSNPTRPGIYVICVNLADLSKEGAKEPRPGFFATCRQPEVAQMLCDGVNFLFKCQKQMADLAAAGQGPEQAQVPFQPVVVEQPVPSVKVDGAPTPDAQSPQQ